tara:strand:+ start:459 stop:701 length:243 start_codon:yes stop_codon:yes gene_type:complete
MNYKKDTGQTLVLSLAITLLYIGVIKMDTNQLLKNEVMIKFIMKRFNKTREQAIADLPPDVRKNINVKENKFLSDHFEII